MGNVRLERIGAAATIVIDRPESYNAISRPTMRELSDALDEVETSSVSVLALRGAGDRIFVSGGDLKELASIRTVVEAEEMASQMRTFLDRVASFPIPVIGVLNGSAFGGGCEVAVACDFRIAPDDIRLAFNQVDLAIMPAWGGIERLIELIGYGRAMYLVTTGRPIAVKDAESWGLVEEVVTRDAFESKVDELIERISAVPATALRGIKSVAASVRLHSTRPGAANTAFANAWVSEAHWEAVQEMEVRRRDAKLHVNSRGTVSG